MEGTHELDTKGSGRVEAPGVQSLGPRKIARRDTSSIPDTNEEVKPHARHPTGMHTRVLLASLSQDPVWPLG